MKRNIWIIGLLVVTVSLSAQAQLAEDALRFSQYRLGVGAQTLSLGGASVGISNDFTALFSNPAGLAQQRDYEFSLGFSQNSFSNDVSFWHGKESVDNNKFNLDNLGFVYPIPTRRGSLTFALGFGRMQQFNTASSFGGFNIQNSFVEVLTPTNDLWAMSPDDRRNFLDNDISYQLWLSDTSNGYLWPILTDSLYQHGNIIEEGGINHWSIGMGIDIAPNFSFGVSFNLASGKYSYDREYVESDVNNVYHYAFPWNINRFLYLQNVTDDISGFNMLLGVMYRVENKFRIGLTLRTPTWYSISEGYGTKYQSEFDNGYKYWQDITNSSEYSITTPMILSGGLSIQPVHWFLLSGDVEYVDYTQIEMKADDPTLNDHLKEQENRARFSLFRETTNLRGGAEVSLLNDILKLRGGIAWYPSPYKSDRSTTKYDRMYYTAGIGFCAQKNISINLAFALGDWKSTQSTGDLFDVNGATQTNESITTEVFNLTFSYRF
ncbi:MAG TPA: outer membrane protein transport protein [Bacteroidota bacterium]|nr:outer membrane protein transport protein [Bacteroidota bacterium]